MSNGHAQPASGSASGAERAETTLNVRFRVAAEPGLQGEALPSVSASRAGCAAHLLNAPVGAAAEQRLQGLAFHDSCTAWIPADLALHGMQACWRA